LVDRVCSCDGNAVSLKAPFPEWIDWRFFRECQSYQNEHGAFAHASDVTNAAALATCCFKGGQKSSASTGAQGSSLLAGPDMQ